MHPPLRYFPAGNPGRERNPERSSTQRPLITVRVCGRCHHQQFAQWLAHRPGHALGQVQLYGGVVVPFDLGYGAWVYTHQPGEGAPSKAKGLACLEHGPACCSVANRFALAATPVLADELSITSLLLLITTTRMLITYGHVHNTYGRVHISIGRKLNITGSMLYSRVQLLITALPMHITTALVLITPGPKCISAAHALIIHGLMLFIRGLMLFTPRLVIIFPRPLLIAAVRMLITSSPMSHTFSRASGSTRWNNKLFAKRVGQLWTYADLGDLRW